MKNSGFRHFNYMFDLIRMKKSMMEIVLCFGLFHWCSSIVISHNYQDIIYKLSLGGSKL